MTLSKKKLADAVPVALLFSCTLALFGPAQLFLPNSLEFNFSLSQLLPSLAVVTFCLFFLVLLALMLLPDRFRLHERGLALVFALGFLLWFQGTFMVWKYGLFNGHEIDWGEKIAYGLIDTPIWIGCMLLAVWRPAFFSRRAKTLSLVILSIQFLFTSFLVVKQPGLPSFKKFQFVTNKKFDFSNRKNIIVLVLDSFQSDVFQQVIDKDPAAKKYFDDFTYFRNTTGGFPSTYAAVPLILTGQYYTNSQPIQSFMAEAYFAPTSIPHALLARGWQVDLFPSVMQSIYFNPAVMSNIWENKDKHTTTRLAYLFDITLFRYLPHFLKREVFNNEHWFLTRWLGEGDKSTSLDDDYVSRFIYRQAANANRKLRRSLPRIHQVRRNWLEVSRSAARDHLDVVFVTNFLKKAKLVPDKDIFKFYHWRGIHEPIRLNANLEPVERSLNRANGVDLARGELKMVHFFLQGLKELGAYDNSLIFILGDHGHPYGGFDLRLPASMDGRQSAKGPLPPGVHESGLPLLLVKRPGDRGDLVISDAPASLVDIQATVFASAGLEKAGTGEPLFQIPPDRPRERRFLYYRWDDSDWMNLYLPNLIEYRIDGNAWLTSSWHETGRVFKPRK